MNTASWLDTPLPQKMERMWNNMLDEVQEIRIFDTSDRLGIFQEEKDFLTSIGKLANKLELLAHLSIDSVKDHIQMRPELVERLRDIFLKTDSMIIENPIFELASKEIRQQIIEANTILSEAICYYSMANAPELEHMFEMKQASCLNL